MPLSNYFRGKNIINYKQKWYSITMLCKNLSTLQLSAPDAIYHFLSFKYVS